ncbi:low molecular weight protein-tyrosine-phosphatase [Moheibacter lacus]|uniref:protein-tyrosine-phosphatase n=1 Tax=Moheibacter lacus TaxID=2745851 RepID=A0A838ZUD5_9FLAO|nr:low molecular weight protein-tyrosine-phosphatase [Moheibacter lacus]MBA5630604.1 low molecular weight phosphotyrosine protein phosphatase [Moheibacter lacus]
MKILMVCLGNICRSPLAEGILQSKLTDGFTVDSAGTGDWHVGNSPDERSIAVAKKYGIDISKQRARQFQLDDFEKFDLIFVMDQSNFENVLKLTKNDEQRQKVKLILGDQNVLDPYYGGEEGFETVFHLLDQATDTFLSEFQIK